MLQGVHVNSAVWTEDPLGMCNYLLIFAHLCKSVKHGIKAMTLHSLIISFYTYNILTIISIVKCYIIQDMKDVSSFSERFAYAGTQRGNFTLHCYLGKP